jgi:hypothetical protein
MNEPILIDGILTESIWNNGSGISEFTQRDPQEGKPASQLTTVHVAFDDNALYVAASMKDVHPDSIVARLGRRDEHLESDYFAVYIDPYLDRRSGYFFGLNAGGTVYDGVLSNDDWSNSSWDGIWDGQVKINSQGWTAEMRIPFSQLRFHPQESYTWGINFRRDIARHNEEAYVAYKPKNESGFVSRFPLLTGIEGISSARNLEVLPYLRTKSEYIHTDAEDPFNDGSRHIPGFGADIKYGVSNNLTLDATFNPDFGQVEVDPAVVNLSDMETFFSEKRPFFIEGANIFDFGWGGSNSFWSFNWGNPDFFYTRRIGRTPQGSIPDNDYADVPDGTRILSAGKMTGKAGEDWNIGTLHAVTAREFADFEMTGQQSRTEVEPLTYYSVSRVQKEFDKGRQGMGFIYTTAWRDFEEDRLRDDINSSGTTFGVDGWTFLDREKVWVVSGWMGTSHIRGSRQRLLDLQTSSRHYFQRPDAGHVSVDSSATSLTGYAGRVTVNKQKGNITFNSAIGFIDPRFNVNDLGFFWRNDIINSHVAGGYKWTEPGRLTRDARFNVALFGSSDFDGNMTWGGIFANNWLQFHNYYSLSTSFAYNPETVNNRLTRGGPLTTNPPGWELNTWLNTDNRKSLVLSLGTYGYFRNSDEWYRGFELDLEWKPSTKASISFGPEIFWNKEFAQWVDSFDDPTATSTYSSRYVFANMDQTELSASLRLNWTFTPKLSLQTYLQPLISSGNYYSFKELARPSSYEFNTYGEDGSSISMTEDTYNVDPDGPGPADTFEFDNPDFNFKSLRGNMVLRWEYRPGSTLYLVWTQQRYEEEIIGDFQFSRSFKRLWTSPADNIFMIKFTYWLNI